MEKNLEEMDKESLIQMVLKQKETIACKDSLNGWLSEENNKLRTIIEAMKLILNNVKK